MWESIIIRNKIKIVLINFYQKLPKRLYSHKVSLIYDKKVCFSIIQWVVYLSPTIALLVTSSSDPEGLRNDHHKSADLL